MKKLISLSVSLLLFNLLTLKGQNEPKSTNLVKLANSSKSKAVLAQESIINSVKFREVGPVVMSGRVTDIAVDPTDATHFYVAYASGGLWETQNNGSSFKPLFDNELVMSIGDIAVNW